MTDLTTVPCEECETKTLGTFVSPAPAPSSEAPVVSSSSSSAPATVSSHEGAAVKNVAGVFAGVAAVAAALF